MSKDIVTNKQLYDAIRDIEKKIDEVVEKRITPLEVWRGSITAQLAVFGTIALIAINIVIDYIKDLFKKGGA